MADVIFHTHATTDTGFGHAARCGRLAALLAGARPGCAIVFEGDFDEGARASLAGLAPLAFSTGGETARLGVYDRMDDTEDPEAWSADRLDDLRARCARVVFLANGMRRPGVPADVTVIGYKPAGPRPAPPRMHWGLEFAPVASMATDEGIARGEGGRALLALGGARGSSGVRTALQALSMVEPITHIDVLDSPVNPIELSRDWVRADQILTSHRSVPSVAPLIACAGIVLASYGHLGYEALALGRPLCLVGQKAFQADYAERLAAAGLCVAAGRLDALDATALATALRRTLAAADDLSAARGSVDDRGLDRIAALLGTMFDETA